MDKISKALKRLSPKERLALKHILLKIKENDLSDFDIKKLKGHDNVYRIRKGKIRIIIFIKERKVKILTIERRSDNTYNF